MSSLVGAKLRRRTVVLALCGAATIARAHELVVTQVPLDSPPGSADGARLVIVGEDGSPRVLTRAFHAATDPDVSFDGATIAFAGKRSAGDPWCVYTIGVDGSGAQRVSCGPGSARSPIWLPLMHTLTPTSTEAWAQLAFAGAAPGRAAESTAAALTNLYACRLDGSGLRQLTYNLAGDADPHVLPDGRVVYAARQSAMAAGGAEPRVALLGANTDGTDPLVFAGDEGLRVKRSPAATTAGLVVFVEGDAVGADGAGRLGAVSLRRNLHSYRPLGGAADGQFRSPAPHPDGGVLVAWRAKDGSDYGIWHLDLASGRRTQVFDDPRWDDVQARIVAARPLPDGRSSPVRDDAAEGKLYAIDVNIADLAAAALPRGTARRLRVVEGLALDSGATGSARRRLLGEIALAEDGSFQVQVPANTPIELQLLDADGLALRSCGWIWARNHANQGCVGCHEDPDRAPPNRFAAALASAAPVLAPEPALRSSVDFRRDVGRVVEVRCAGCHAAGQALPRLDTGAEATYRTLLADYVQPGRARASRVVWHLLGRNTARPWDPEATAGTARPLPAGTPPPAADELRTIVEWIDLGAPWDGGAR